MERKNKKFSSEYITLSKHNIVLIVNEVSWFPMLLGRFVSSLNSANFLGKVVLDKK